MHTRAETFQNIVLQTYMTQGDNKIIRRRYIHSMLSSVVSISLVLLLVGIAGFLLVSGRGVSDYLKENMQISVMMKRDVGETAALRYKKAIDGEPFVKSSAYVSKEQGAKEMAELLGDDFLGVFETAPIPASVNLTLKADYVSPDSLAMVKAALEKSPDVEEVIYQQSLVEALNSNLSKISLFLAVFIALLLFISFVLINNTVRLSVYSKRFSIHTMKMVGATWAFIRRPFLLQSAFQGLFAALVAIVMIIAGLFILKGQFAQLFAVFSLKMLLEVMAIVVTSGLLICVASTWFTVNKLLALNKSELYY